MEIHRIFVYFSFFSLCVSGIGCMCVCLCSASFFILVFCCWFFILSALYGIVNMPKLPACYIFDFLLLFSTFTHRIHAHSFNCRYPAFNVSPNNHTHRQSRQLNDVHNHLEIHFESFRLHDLLMWFWFRSSLVSTQHQF